MNETARFVDSMYELTSDTEAPMVREDTLAERLFAIKPPGKGDSGMAEERS